MKRLATLAYLSFVLAYRLIYGFPIHKFQIMNQFLCFISLCIGGGTIVTTEACYYSSVVYSLKACDMTTTFFVL